MWHIMDRFIIHLFASGGVLLAVLFGLRYFLRRLPTGWMPQQLPQQIVFAAVCIFGGACLREAYDVAHGQELLKAFTDYLSWAAGCGLSAWGLIRIQKGKL